MMSELALPIRWRPILVGGVFNAVNQQINKARESMFANEKRLAHYYKDMMNWADFIGVKICQPDVFPVNSVKGMRGALFAAEQDLIEPYSRALFEAYWSENKDISQSEVLIDVCQRVGLDSTAFLSAIVQQRFKDLLRDNTLELVDRGGYGSPTLFINGDDMYFVVTFFQQSSVGKGITPGTGTRGGGSGDLSIGTAGGIEPDLDGAVVIHGPGNSLDCWPCLTGYFVAVTAARIRAVRQIGQCRCRGAGIQIDYEVC